MAARLGTHILDVALEQFIAHGAESPSMDAIAAAAKVSKRTLYSRHGSKEMLLIAAVEHGIAKVMEIERIAVPKGKLEDKLFVVGKKLLNAALDPRVVAVANLAIWINDHCASPGQKTIFQRHQATQTIRNIVEDAMQDGLRVSDPESFTSLLFYNLVIAPRDRILVWHTLPNTAAAKNAYLRQTIAFLLYGAAGSPG